MDAGRAFCQCPDTWIGVVPPPCEVHNPATPRGWTLTTLAKVESRPTALVHAVESFLLWWDMPPHVYSDEDISREIEHLRRALESA